MGNFQEGGVGESPCVCLLSNVDFLQSISTCKFLCSIVCGDLKQKRKIRLCKKKLNEEQDQLKKRKKIIDKSKSIELNKNREISKTDELILEKEEEIEEKEKGGKEIDEENREEIFCGVGENEIPLIIPVDISQETGQVVGNEGSKKKKGEGGGLYCYRSGRFADKDKGGEEEEEGGRGETEGSVRIWIVCTESSIFIPLPLSFRMPSEALRSVVKGIYVYFQEQKRLIVNEEEEEGEGEIDCESTSLRKQSLKVKEIDPSSEEVVIYDKEKKQEQGTCLRKEAFSHTRQLKQILQTNRVRRGRGDKKKEEEQEQEKEEGDNKRRRVEEGEGSGEGRFEVILALVQGVECLYYRYGIVLG